MSQPSYARVVIDRSIHRELDYLIPELLAEKVAIGSRVRVPFRERSALATVVAVLEESDAKGIRPIEALVGDKPVLSAKLIELARWMSAYYCCPIETVMRSLLPQVVRRAEVSWKKQLFVSAAKEIARVARVPGFRVGKAPISLIKRRFADDIKGEVLQSLVPERVEKAVAEQKLNPVSQPQVDKLDFNDGQPLKFRAVFEVLPEFDLGSYKGLEIEMPAMDVTDEDVNRALEETRERAAAFVPVEGRAIENGDYAQLKLVGTPEDGGEPLQADSVLCHVGAEETMEPFNENLRGANIEGVDFYLVDLRGAKYTDDQREYLKRCGAILRSRAA